MTIAEMLKKRAEKNRKLKKDRPVCQLCGDLLTLPDEVKFGVCRACGLTLKSEYLDETSEDKWRTDAYIEQSGKDKNE